MLSDKTPSYTGTTWLFCNFGQYDTLKLRTDLSIDLTV